MIQLDNILFSNLNHILSLSNKTLFA